MSPHNKVKVTNGPVKRMGRPPKKGTHTTTSSLGNVIHIDEGDEEAAGAGTKRARTEEVAGPEAVSEKAEGGSSSGLHKFMMFGATLNPASGMAKEMNTVLQVSLSTPISAKFILKLFQNEVAAHSDQLAALEEKLGAAVNRHAREVEVLRELTQHSR